MALSASKKIGQAIELFQEILFPGGAAFALPAFRELNFEILLFWNFLVPFGLQSLKYEC
jgi:hypothetical protein